MAIKRYMSVASILAAAIPLIQQGWTQGTAKETDNNGKTSYCAAGAIEQVSRNMNVATRAQTAVENTLGVYGLVSWNDTDGRRKRDVVNAFKRTIKAQA